MTSDSLAFPLGARPHLRDVVYQAVRERALEARNDTASYLREADLARALGVSRTPVREALSRLAHEGIVELEPRRGARLVPSTLEDYVQWCELREVLEGQAARLASERADPDDLKRLEGLLTAFDTKRASAEPAAYAQVNAAFHAAIFDAARNPILMRAVEMFGHHDRARLGLIARLDRGGASLAEHRKILDAIAARDGDAAESAARAHVRSLREAARAKLREADFGAAPQVKSPPAQIDGAGTGRTSKSPVSGRTQ